MYLVFSVLILIACILLILIVLVQNSKGGGLASNFASSTQVMGARQTADFLEKATWTLAVSLLVLCLLATLTIPRDKIDESRSILEEQVERAHDPTAIPSFPVTLPDEDGDQD